MTGTQVAVADYRPDWWPADTYLLIRRVRLDAAAGQVSADPAPGPPAGPALPPPRPPTGLTFAHRDAGPPRRRPGRGRTSPGSSTGAPPARPVANGSYQVVRPVMMATWP